MIKTTLPKLLLGILGLLLLFLLATVLFFIATPKEIRVEQPIPALHGVADSQFKLESGLLTGRQWVEGNSIETLIDGKETFASILRDMNQAESSITKETYMFFGDEVAASVSEALADASGRGVNVHFLMDYIGSVMSSEGYFNTMEEAEVELVRWRRPQWYQLARFNHRTHRKLMVMDGQVAYTGGVNTADPWIEEHQDGGYKDYHFRITGPVVNEIQAAFSENWVSSRGKLLSGPSYYTEIDPAGELSVQVTTSHPREGQSKVRKMMLYAIASAQESIRIGTAYFFPDDQVVEALIQAAERGVSIQILMPGEDIDQNFVRLASQTLWGDLLDAGIELYEYQPTMYHAKMMIVDEYYTTVGSTNFDNRSFRLNDETNIGVLGEDFSREMAGYYDADLEDAALVTPGMWADRSLWEKTWGRIVARVLGPYL